MKRASIAIGINISLILIVIISELNYKGGTCGPYPGDLLLLGLILFSGFLSLFSVIIKITSKEYSWLTVAVNLITLAGLITYTFYMR